MNKKILVVISGLILGCSTQETDDRSKPYIQTVSCLETARACHDEALRVCPNGYRVMNKVKGEKVGQDTIYKVSVLCRPNPYKNAY